MKKFVIFGAGSLGNALSMELSEQGNVIGFLDNDYHKWGSTVNGILVLGNVAALDRIEYDEIIIASTMHFDTIKKELLEYGINEEKFNKEFMERLTVEIKSRSNFLRDFSKLHSNEYPGASVAEGGVYQGMFAQEINQYFPDRRLYLFDTFEGFSSKDVEIEIRDRLSKAKENCYGETTVELVLNKMLYRKNVIIRQGYFPDTLDGLENERFLFVNLDFDLYLPILAGLRFFYPRMVDGGVILVHDYFTKIYHGVSKAIDEFEKELDSSLIKTPIGDGISIAIFPGGTK